MLKFINWPVVITAVVVVVAYNFVRKQSWGSFLP